MSRIGRKPINLPQQVTVKMEKDAIVVAGPKGTLRCPLMPYIGVTQQGNQLLVARHKEDRQTRAYHGLVRALLANAVRGVTEGFTRKLSLVGVGYRADLRGKSIVFQLGYSHPIEFPIPEGIKVEIDNQNNITLWGIDKQKVGQMAAEIRRLRPPDPYKGKGVRYAEEVIHRKVGKGGA